MSYERCDAWWSTLSGDERSEVVTLRGEIPERWAQRMLSANIFAVRAELADAAGRHDAWLMPTTLRDFLEQRMVASPAQRDRRDSAQSRGGRHRAVDVLVVDAGR